MLPILYPIKLTGSLNLLSPYHVTQCICSVDHIMWYTVTSLCGSVQVQPFFGEPEPEPQVQFSKSLNLNLSPGPGLVQVWFSFEPGSEPKGV